MTATSLNVPRGGIDWGYVSDRVGRFGLPMLMMLACISIVAAYGWAPELLWPDAHIYYRATEAWVAGANPWAASFHGVYFAAPPPALLLNLPLLPFGEDVATAAWVLGGLVAVVLLIRHLKLPPWWVFFYPIAEGWTAASPDLVVAALVYANAGALNASPSHLLGYSWLAIGLPVGLWLMSRGRPLWAGLAMAPYLLPQYWMLALGEQSTLWLEGRLGHHQ